jgi:hypothetical protein
MTEDTTDRRKRLAELSKKISSAGSKNDLIDAIEDALAVSAPVGDPATLETLGKLYHDQKIYDVYARVDNVARKGLPEVWVGETGVAASAVIAAASQAAGNADRAFLGGGDVLIDLAAALKAAQQQDAGGRRALRETRATLGGKDGFFDDWYEDDVEEANRLIARDDASYGVGELYDAAVAADDAAREAARALNAWAAEARAGHLHSKNLTAADRLALADISNIDGDAEKNEILSANDLERSGRAMDRLSAADRTRMDDLLASASTPQEKAYLMKALASGYSVDDVATFGGKIHGKDAAWLEHHLTPVTTTVDSGQESQSFEGKLWDQDGATCVPSSTVTARALVDPVYALQLTGGPTGQDDDPDHFRKRLTDEQMRLHEEGDGDYTHFWSDTPAGMDSDGQVEISNKELSPHTGDHYESHDMHGADDRRDVLTDVEKSVADGKPVPINVEGHEKNGDWVGHGMMIIGQEGDKLQIYNPWGTTTWVSEDDFVKGDLSAASDDRFDNVNRVYIDQD